MQHLEPLRCLENPDSYKKVSIPEFMYIFKTLLVDLLFCLHGKENNEIIILFNLFLTVIIVCSLIYYLFDLLEIVKCLVIYEGVSLSHISTHLCDLCPKYNIYNVIYLEMSTFLPIFTPGFPPLRPQNEINLGEI